MIVPDKDEAQSAYVARAVSEATMVARYADPMQRSAVAHAHFRNFQRTGHILGSRANFAVLRGVEIFAVGTWNGREFTDAHIDGIISSFEAMSLAGRIPLKLGHDGADVREHDGAPALGWVQRLYRDGARLMADFSDIPRVLHDAIQQGLYKFVSIELLRDVKADTRIIPWVLDGVALLGATQPAVGILKDLQSLTMARGSGLQGVDRVAFSRADDTQSTSSGGNQAMSEETLKAQLAEAEKKATDEAAARKKAEDDLLKFKSDQQAAADAAKKEKVKLRREAITKLFNDAVAAERIDPKAREEFAALTGYETDDAATERITDTQVNSHIDKVGKPAKKGRVNQSADRGGSGGAGGESDEPDYADMPPDKELSDRAFRLCAKRNQDPSKGDYFLRASQEILRSDSDLAERYKFMPTDRFSRSAD